VIGPLAALRERRDRREEATEQGEVEPGDREAAERGRQRLRLRRQRGTEDAGPGEREREVHRGARGQQQRRAPRARQQHAAERAGAVERVAALDERPHRRGEPGDDRSGQAGGEDV